VKLASAVLVVTGMAALLSTPALGQTSSQADAQKKEPSPLYRITVVARTTKAINYRHLSGPTKINFQGTVLLPLGRGEAKVESRRGAIRVQAQFDKLERASRFGPEFLTYALWAVSPEGRADNLGEVVLEGQKSKLDVTTQLQAFALIVTAEPYFAVSQPSDVVVLENVVRPDTVGSIQEMDAKFDLLQRGQYSIVQGGFQSPAPDPRVPLGLLEARNAVQIAKAAGAERYAADSLKKAVQLLEGAEADYTHKRPKKQIEAQAREAVQTAEDARTITVKRLDEERQAKERQAAAEREALAKAQTEAAERAKLEAQLAAERAARERAEAEAARAAAQAQQQAALAQQQAAQQEAERSRLAAERAARDTAAAEAARAAALLQQQAAQEETERARKQAAESERARQQAEAEKAELRKRLLDQLNSVLQTRDSARGLIVNMSDVLFDFGKYTLKPGAREKLAKISGIVLAHPGLNLQVEGHTDSVGSDEYNQLLSEQRASGVREFLVEQGVPAASVTARGFGKAQPVATNDTPEGRQRNRRVELVVTGDAIGTSAAGSTPVTQ
jgi:outer membrane protein OmpA-like peptidoglycan-associated protein